MKIGSRQELTSFREVCEKRLACQSKQILVCGGSGCVAGGSLDIYARFKEIMESKGLKVDVVLQDHVDHGDSVGVKKSGCQGFCEIGPLVKVEPEGYFYCKVKPEDCEDIVNEIFSHFCVGK